MGYFESLETRSAEDRVAGTCKSHGNTGVLTMHYIYSLNKLFTPYPLNITLVLKGESHRSVGGIAGQPIFVG